MIIVAADEINHSAYSHDSFTIEYANELNARGNRNNVPTSYYSCTMLVAKTNYDFEMSTVERNHRSVIVFLALLKQLFSVSIIGHTACNFCALITAIPLERRDRPTVVIPAK